jgi:ATP-dependent helicase Lhr and Lhr-like helicase
VVTTALQALETEGRVVEGEFRPGGAGREWIDVEVLRRLRRKSLAAYRREIEPAPPDALARFYLAWNGIGPAAGRAPVEGPAAVDALYEVVETLQGAPVPASMLERQILPARLAGYSPALLDELCASGEVVWCGAGPIGSDDGWIVLATAERASLLLPGPQEADLSPLALRIRDVLEERGALFFRQIATEVESTDDSELLLALWELTWAGWSTNDTIVPMRALMGRGPRRPQGRRRRRGPSFPQRTGPPAGAGRWGLVADRSGDPTRRLHAAAEQMLARHGIVTRGSIAAERIDGGFAGIYPVFKAMEESGRCRRGYFVDGLGGAQFAESGAVDRMRSLVNLPAEQMQTELLAATDPASPYGAALPWPERDSAGSTHRPGRKAGALVVLVGGRLVLYVEKGGRSLLSFTEDEDDLRPAVDALALAVRDGTLGTVAVQKADGEDVFDSPLARLLTETGFRMSSRGLRLRA